MKTKLLLPIAMIAVLAMTLPVIAEEPVDPGEAIAPDQPFVGELSPIPGSDFMTGPGYRAGLLVDVVVGPNTCGWR